MAELQSNKLYFGLHGLSTTIKPLQGRLPIPKDLGGGIIKIRKVTTTGDIVDALGKERGLGKGGYEESQQLPLAMVYSDVNHEIEVTLLNREIEDHDIDLINMVIKVYTFGLRILSQAPVRLVAVIDFPWEELSKQKRGTVWTRVFDGMKEGNLGQTDQKKITKREIIWLSDHFSGFFSLMGKNEKFTFAVDSFNNFEISGLPRIAITSLWSGIESLFSAEQETTFQISLQIASLLKKPGKKRLMIFKKIQKMYGFRSRLIHGGRASKEKISDHLNETIKLLSEILIRITELGYLPTRDELLLLQKIKFK